MSNYVKAVDYSAKDALASGNPNKIIKGTELNDEFNAIATAVGTKADLSSPTFLGNPSATTQPLGDNSTRIATTAFVQNELVDLAANVNITGGTIDDVDITGGTISGLDTVIAVADGGTGSATLTANSVLLGNGTSTLLSVAPSTAGNILTSNGTTWESAALGVIGVGQTWKNVLSSRALGATYTNSTNKPIMISVSISNGGAQLTLTVDGVVIGPITYIATWIIPPGSTYSVTTTIGALFHWSELS